MTTLARLVFVALICAAWIACVVGAYRSWWYRRNLP